MRHRIEEIERLAMTGCGLPEGYSQPEQLLFLSLRILHWEFRNRIIGREQARHEKKLLVDDFCSAETGNDDKKRLCWPLQIRRSASLELL